MKEWSISIIICILILSVTSYAAKNSNVQEKKVNSNAISIEKTEQIVNEHILQEDEQDSFAESGGDIEVREVQSLFENSSEKVYDSTIENGEISKTNNQPQENDKGSKITIPTRASSQESKAVPSIKETNQSSKADDPIKNQNGNSTSSESKDEGFQLQEEKLGTNDPIVKLRKVTLENIDRSERFYDGGISANSAPFYVEGKNFYFKYPLQGKKLYLMIFGNGKDVLFDKGIPTNTTPLEIPQGTYRFQFSVSRENHIEDRYQGSIIVAGDGQITLDNYVFRYTYVKVQPRFEQNSRVVSNFSETFLTATAIKLDNGKVKFEFSMGALKEEDRLGLSMDWDNIMPLQGKKENVKVSLVMEMKESYNFQSQWSNENTQKIIRGNLFYDMKTGEIKLKNADLTTIFFKGYEYFD